ncbi:hypothetical protein PISMIDRAFT_17465 [Pisolithus microcarpus 441]|uniref:Unplaced genomic scaffold scaffold_266, whole genome shotgun sequence n=1 Tax=Pisolithus microcarpus 441 TaxID=765257 RepID=A0A0C9Z2F4_9AGAM|nr:hypothetical protein PISMIDRAFT_17465 [Pisolithus microcarpus 441]
MCKLRPGGVCIAELRNFGDHGAGRYLASPNEIYTSGLTAVRMPRSRKTSHEHSCRWARITSSSRCSSRLRNRMVGRGSGSKGKAPSTSGYEPPKLRATWTDQDVLTLLDFVEERRSKAGDHMAFQEGHFNDLLPHLLVQPNGHCKTAKNCHDKWESLKRDYYAASAVAGGSGLAYSAEKGANVVTEAGQLVMDELVETRPEAAQFQSKGFKYWERMHQFVPPDKARGINAHHATGSCFFVQSSQVTPMSSQFSSTTALARIPPSMPPPVYPSSSQPTTHFQPPSASRPTVQNTFVPFQAGRFCETQTPQTAQMTWPAVNSQAMPVTLPIPTSSPSSIPVSPPSSAITSISTSVNPSSSLSSRGRKRKSDATGGLAATSTEASSAAGTSSSQKRRSQYGILEDTVKGFITDWKEANQETKAVLDEPSEEQKFQDICSLMYSLEKDLSPKNIARLQMILEEKHNAALGYKALSSQSELTRKWWVRNRLEEVGYSVLEYAFLDASQ